MKKKLLIIYANYGSGHKCVANYIKDRFSKNEEYQIMVLDIMNYLPNFFNIGSRKFFEKTCFKFPIIFDILYNLFNTNKIPTDKLLLKIYGNKKLKNIIGDFNPDLTISTHTFSSTIVGMYKKDKLINTKLITILTDYETHAFWIKSAYLSDAFIVSSKEEKRLVKNKKIDPKIIKVYGIPLGEKANPANYIPESIKKYYKINNNKKTILFYGQNGNTTSAYPYIKKVLKADLDINILFISGGNTKIESKVKELVKEINPKNTNIRVLGYSNIPELLSVADLIVTKPGGTIITESLYFRKPMIFYTKNSGQEKSNHKYIERNGCGKKVKTPTSMVNYLTYLVESDLMLDRMSRNSHKIANNNAMENLYFLSEELLEKNK